MRGKRVDSNQTAIKQALEAVGWYVHDTSGLGYGFADLVAAKGGKLRLIEVKDGAKPKSARKLTQAEYDFFWSMREAGVEVHLIESVDQALELR